MAYTFDDLRAKYPDASDTDIREAVRLLNKPVLSIRQIWDSEAQVGTVSQGVGPAMLSTIGHCHVQRGIIDCYRCK